MENNVKIAEKNTTGQILPQLNEALENAKTIGNEYWEKAKEKGQSILDDTQFKVRKTLGQAKSLIQKHPGKAVGYAILLGVIAGILISRKRRD